MVHIKKETINQNNKRIWGSFKLSDNTTTKFECKKNESWFQWGNTTDNLCLTVEKVEKLVNKWLEKYC